jgi:large subunit ribosomal protein L13
VVLSGNKMQNKEYQWFTGYPGGQRSRSAQEMLNRKPYALVEEAVRGMLPKNRLGREMFRNLHVFVGPDHKHEAQQPELLSL